MLHGSKYFSSKEFACKCGCGFGSKPEDIAPDLLFALHHLRGLLAVPFVVTSGARCPKHNLAEGGKQRSTHLPGGVGGPCTPEFIGQCRAADIAVGSWSMGLRAQLVATALLMGLRVGISTGFIHIDVERSPAYEDGLWNYANKETSGD